MYYNKPKYDVTTITVTSYDRKVSIEIPLDSDAHEVFDTFKTIMVGMTFHEQTFNDMVAAYFYEHNLGKDDAPQKVDYVHTEQDWRATLSQEC
jgi:hypothetical protein